MRRPTAPDVPRPGISYYCDHPTSGAWWVVLVGLTIAVGVAVW